LSFFRHLSAAAGTAVDTDLRKIWKKETQLQEDILFITRN